jgi:hypothetical protein
MLGLKVKGVLTAADAKENRTSHREAHGAVAIPWRTRFRSQRDCFVAVLLAMPV